MVDIDQAAQPIKVQQQAVGGGNVIEGMSSADDLDRSTGLRCSGDQSDKIIDGVRMGDVPRCELRLPGQFVHRATVGRLTRIDSGRGSRSTMAKGGARSDVTACSRSVTMPIHSP